MEQLQHQMAFEQKPTPTDLYRRALGAEVSPEVVNFIEKRVPLNNIWDLVILQTSSPLNLINSVSWRGTDDSAGVGSIINVKRINDIRYVNKFLESANEYLRMGGYFIGCVETSRQREQRIMKKFPPVLNQIYYFFDFILKRVWPKMPRLKQLYFLLTGGRNRVISEMETYGRLYSCGFKLVDRLEVDGLLYFIAEKTGEPDYNNEASYGPLIKLKRVGKHGKPIKVYKFRTMYPYSEYIQELVYELNGLGNTCKFKEDPRVNSLGRFMRKYWLDELPMLWNFLKGEMKLFGVRPLSRHYMSLYPEDFQAYRKQFKPGLIPPVYVEIPETIEDVVAIEGRYLAAYEREGWITDVKYIYRAFYNIIIKKVRSK
jgi:lipopolysaccharide/colanic/teichoic acid biosynthesis glycosyltransferase